MTIYDFIQQLKCVKEAEEKLCAAYYNNDRVVALTHKAKAEAYDYVIFTLTNSVMYENKAGE